MKTAHDLMETKQLVGLNIFFSSALTLLLSTSCRLSLISFNAGSVRRVATFIHNSTRCPLLPT